MMKLFRRLKMAWRAFCAPDDVFFRMVDPDIAAAFPDMPASFRTHGASQTVVRVEPF